MSTRSKYRVRKTVNDQKSANLHRAYLHTSMLIRRSCQCDSFKYFHQSSLNCFYVSLYGETYNDLHDNNT